MALRPRHRPGRRGRRLPPPLDDPIRWRLADPRGARTTRIDDFLWIRVLDPPAALTARSYHQPGRLVLDVATPGGGSDPATGRRMVGGDPDPAAGRWVLGAGSDPAAGRWVLGAGSDPAAGRWVLDANHDGAACSRAGPGDATALRLGLADLGALYLGGVTATMLAGAGRVGEERPGALAVADRLFATVPGPFSGTGF